jgi:transcriptional regulator with XRE-family HTH domain
MDIASRIKSVRHHFSLQQREMASKLDVGFSSYQKYEMGLTMPGGDALKSFAVLGVNTNWLLTGDGEMMLADAQPETDTPQSAINVHVLTEVLAGLELYLEDIDADLSPGRKADLIVVLYEHFIDKGEAEKGAMYRLLKLVA